MTFFSWKRCVCWNILNVFLIIHIPAIHPSTYYLLLSVRQEFTERSLQSLWCRVRKELQEMPGRLCLLSWKTFLCRSVSRVRRWSSQTHIYFRAMLSLGPLLNALQLSSKLINPSEANMVYTPNTKTSCKETQGHGFAGTFQWLQQ